MKKNNLKMKMEARNIYIDYQQLSKDVIALFFKELITAIKKKYPEIAIHVAPTVYASYKREINKNLFVTGLGYTYSESQIDHVTLIKKNLSQNFRLDYLDYDWYNEHHVSHALMDQYNLNYIPAFMEMYKAYDSSGDRENAQIWKDKVFMLVKREKNEDLLKAIEMEIKNYE